VPYVNMNGARLFYEEAGAGPPVVLVDTTLANLIIARAHAARHSVVHAHVLAENLDRPLVPGVRTVRGSWGAQSGDHRPRA